MGMWRAGIPCFWFRSRCLWQSFASLVSAGLHGNSSWAKASFSCRLKFNQGSKSAPAFRKARKRAIFLLFLSTAILFSIFFFLFGAFGLGLTYHSSFSSENSREKSVLFSGVFPDSPIGHIACKLGWLWERHAKRNPGPGYQATA